MQLCRPESMCSDFCARGKRKHVSQYGTCVCASREALALRAQLTRQTASGMLVAVIDGLSPAEYFKGV